MPVTASHNRPCFICGTTASETRVSAFACLWYWIVEPICLKCWNIPTDEPKSGEWGEPGELPPDLI